MNFNDFSFNEHITAAIRQCGFTAPTPIQQQAIPSILERRDLLGLAQTGTGKTAAFILPTVQHLLQTPGKALRALIIAPTRELAEQINEFTQKIISNTRLQSIAVYGGVGKQGQIHRIKAGVDIVVACPGRLLDILNDRAIDLSKIDTLILDEADRMFDQGFLPDIRRILRTLPKERQNLVFSATMPDEIRHLAEDILTRPVTVQINPSRSVLSISHRLYPVEQGQKAALLTHLLKSEAMPTTLVFTRTKHRAKSLAQKLAQSGFKATSLHGNLSQNKRQQALDGFKNGEYSVLVATDIAARGIDVSNISHVVNFDMPDTAEAYIHRTGRTGRAACTGDALTFGTKEDNRMIRLIEQTLDDRLSRQAITFPHQPLIAKTEDPANGDRQGNRENPSDAARTRSSRRKNAVQPKEAAAKRNTTYSIFGLSGRSK
jgi:ATP-dependent RNA helicase RhlE